MPEGASPKPPRRPRYAGKNPRQFHEKYKELQPDRYAAEIEKIIAAGKTPAGTHRPIMVQEILNALQPLPGQTIVDCTLGHGGHATELLKAVQPGGRLIGVDSDPLEFPKTEARLRALEFAEDSLILQRMNFAGLPQLVCSIVPDGADLLLADLGLSSMQIDNPARGFTFKSNGPLDMRMNANHGRPASALLSSLDVDQLAAILSENSDEPNAVPLAEAILKAHQKSNLSTTSALADVIRTAWIRLPRPREGTDDDAVRRIFQALRIAVNDEFGALDSLLRNLPLLVKPGGRIAILTFHSGEDRRVKSTFRDGLKNGWLAEVNENVVRSSPEEQRANPRSSPAKLRWAVRSNEKS